MLSPPKLNLNKQYYGSKSTLKILSQTEKNYNTKKQISQTLRVSAGKVCSTIGAELTADHFGGEGELI